MFSAVAAAVAFIQLYCAADGRTSIDSLGEFLGAHHWAQNKNKCEQSVDNSFDARLLCYSFVSLRDRYWANIEVLHRAPSIVLFRNAISFSERNQLTLAAKDLVRPALIQNSTTRKHHLSDSRVVNGTFLPRNKFAITERLAAKVRSLTGFNTDCAESFNVLFYDRGGHYYFHHDALILPTAVWTDVFWEDMWINTRRCWQGTTSWRVTVHCMYFLIRDVLWRFRADRLRQYYQQRINSPTQAQLGNRLATFMFYVDVPIAGGGTVFPHLNLTVIANAGDAILWFNVLPDGTNDYDTMHGACPVIDGEKKVTTLWIRQRDQTFSLLCPLAGDKPYAIEDFAGGILGQLHNMARLRSQ